MNVRDIAQIKVIISESKKKIILIHHHRQGNEYSNQVTHAQKTDIIYSLMAIKKKWWWREKKRRRRTCFSREFFSVTVSNDPYRFVHYRITLAPLNLFTGQSALLTTRPPAFIRLLSYLMYFSCGWFVLPSIDQNVCIRMLRVINYENGVTGEKETCMWKWEKLSLPYLIIVSSDLVGQFIGVGFWITLWSNMGTNNSSSSYFFTIKIYMVHRNIKR